MGATVRLVDAARPGGAPDDVLEALLVDPLADEWKIKLTARLWG
ncbi:MAG: hypothetical protein ACRD0Q_00320 [Acidimicrobiales bacterium]